MALAETAQAVGAPHGYKLSAQIKRYTLMDTGFVKTKNGNFQLERALDPKSPYNSALKLRIQVDKDLKKLSMAVTTSNGLRAVDIFKSDKTADNVVQYNYVLDNLIDRQVIEQI